MKDSFANKLKTCRSEKGLTQQQLADKLFVDRSTVANWESGRRIPDADLIIRLADVLSIDAGELLSVHENSNSRPVVILLDDNEIILQGTLPVIKNCIPGADVFSFSNYHSAMKFSSENYISIAFIDIEIGSINGFDVCKELLSINPRTNVIFLTAYPEYSLDAWATGASGFMVKPIMPDELNKQISLLRYPVRGLT